MVDPRALVALLLALLAACVTAQTTPAPPTPAPSPIRRSLAVSTDTAGGALLLASPDSRDRTLLLALTDDAWEIQAPLQFRAASLLLRPAAGSGLQQRIHAPFGFQALLASAGFATGLHVRVVNATHAAATLPREALFDTPAPGGATELVQIVVDGPLLRSGRALGPATFAVRGATSRDAAGRDAWTAAYFVAAVASAVFEHHAVLDVQALAIGASQPCARAGMAFSAAGALRTYAPLSWAEDPSPATVWSSTFIVVALQAVVVAVQFARFPFDLEAQFVFAQEHVFSCVFLPALWSTFRAAYFGFDSESVAVAVFGLLFYVVAVPPLLVVWRLRCVRSARFWDYPWHRTLPWSARWLFPTGFWGDNGFFSRHRWMVANLGRRSLAMVAFPYFVAFGFAAIAGAMPTTPSDCQAWYACLAVWHGLAACFVLYFRIYRSVFLNGALAVTFIVLCLSWVAGAVQAGSTAQWPHDMFLGCAGVILSVVVLRTAFGAYAFFAEDGWRRAAQLVYASSTRPTRTVATTAALERYSPPAPILAVPPPLLPAPPPPRPNQSSTLRERDARHSPPSVVSPPKRAP